MDPNFSRDYLRQKGPKVQFHNADVRNLEQLRDLSRSANVIIHTAGQVAVRTSVLNPREGFEVTRRPDYLKLSSR